MRKRGASVILYVREKDGIIKTLLGKRLYNPGKGNWGLPGGIMEGSDKGSFELTAIRECFEETGIKINPPLNMLEEMEFPNCDWITYYKEISEEDKKEFCSEVMDSMWTDINTLPKPLVNKLDGQFEKLKNILKYF